MGVVGASSLGQLLLKSKLITEEQLLEAMLAQKREGKRLGAVLLRLGYITEDNLTAVLSKLYSVPLYSFADNSVDPSVLRLIPHDTAKKHHLIPVSQSNGTLRIAISDPSNTFAIDAVKSLTGLKINICVATESSIREALEKYHQHRSALDGGSRVRRSEKEFPDADDITKSIDSALEDVTAVDERDDDMVHEIDAPLIKLVNNILLNAIRSRASDIHVEPTEECVRVRYRVDGVLHPILKLPPKIKNAMISRIKIMSHLDIAERRLPQDGRIKLRFGDKREVDFRVSTVPALYGEKVVLRILDKASLQLDLTKLGFEQAALKEFQQAIEKPYGMILVTGPTGSGKTTTLYSALSQLNKPGVNIMTAEDPIEYNFFGINQLQMREDIGLTFAVCLRSFLRQDPDIILVGEIRDYETAEIAAKAALTGHLVLSTLHTNDAPSAITRLIDLKLEPFLVSSSVVLILAQRLARKVCPHCKTEEKFTEEELVRIGFTSEDARTAVCYKGKGCSECSNTGYRGRIALYEVMTVRPELRRLINRDSTADDIKTEALKFGMKTLRQSALTKVKEGLTSIEEVLRVTIED
jgi:type IV pilus assembly protein PilB